MKVDSKGSKGLLVPRSLETKTAPRVSAENEGLRRTPSEGYVKNPGTPPAEPPRRTPSEGYFTASSFESGPTPKPNPIPPRRTPSEGY